MAGDGGGDGEGDDTLRYYLSKSSLVVVGDIIEGPRGRMTAPGVIYFGLKLKVTKVIKGEAEGDILVGLTRYQSTRTKLPEVLTTAGSVILFLNKSKANPKVDSWVGADPWFSIQQYDPVMERLLVRVASE